MLGPSLRMKKTIEYPPPPGSEHHYRSGACNTGELCDALVDLVL